MTPNCNAMAKSIISYLWVSHYTFVFLDSVKNVIYKQNMQWRHRSVCIALCDINKKGVEIGERQNKWHDDIYVNVIFVLLFCTL